MTTTPRSHGPARSGPLARRCAAALGGGRRALRRAARRLQEDRGDVPGWVLITLMTAAIVVALWAVAADQLVAIFQNSMKPFLGGTGE
ncbi:hypothetical protein [Brachybacterium hainanense]|uniref:Uncharacterized protein n=1 Tax=Brachybacterium hainanense TaxID=1541174 RepID=A0ABV6RC65_9MICO